MYCSLRYGARWTDKKSDQGLILRKKVGIGSAEGTQIIWALNTHKEVAWGGGGGWGAGKYSAGLWQSQGFYRWNKHNVLCLFSVPIIREWIVKTFNYKDSFKGAV